MTQHYQGKRRQQSRVINCPTVIIAVFPDGRKGYMDSDTPTIELEEQIAYCAEHGAKAFYASDLEQVCADKAEIEYVKCMMAMRDAQQSIGGSN